jgi:hypothetical protein
MEIYDSSVETRKHIETVGKYIDIIRQGIMKTSDFTENINDATLVDLIICLTNNKTFPGDAVITKINTNSSLMRPNTYSHEKQLKASLNFINDLKTRALLHDESKLIEPEKSEFDIWTPKLAGSTYGSEEYKKFLVELKKALNHHYQNNRHHPEYFSAGILGMNIVDITEMFCDWTAATERHNDGDIFKSIEINQERFEYGPVLAKVFANTAAKHFR